MTDYAYGERVYRDLERAMAETNNTADDVIVEPSDYRSSHKFGHDALAEALWVASLDGLSQDDEAGTTDDIGWHALFHFDQAEAIYLDDGAHGYDRDSTRVTVPRGSYILRTDSSGFVDVTRYALRGVEVTAQWQNIEHYAAPTCLSMPDGSATACGLDASESKTSADINYIDCEDCLRAHGDSWAGAASEAFDS